MSLGASKQEKGIPACMHTKSRETGREQHGDTFSGGLRQDRTRHETHACLLHTSVNEERTGGSWDRTHGFMPAMHWLPYTCLCEHSAPNEHTPTPTHTHTALCVPLSTSAPMVVRHV